jgi:UDPglucose 6-dehydrogenase
MQKIGIIGQGRVGEAIKEGFKGFHELFIYDKFDKTKSNANPVGVVKNSEIIFICVPTPMQADNGQASTHIVEEVVSEIDKISGELGCYPTLIIKSTCPPGTVDMLNHMTLYCDVMFSHEFLTEADTANDFKNQTRIIIGRSGKTNTSHIEKMFLHVFPDATIKVVDTREAEMCKYVINTFLAVKVSFANEIYDICESMFIDYDTTKDLANLDPRLGNSHWMVPGPDGDRGFGGSCFPKDLQALTFMAKQNLVKSTVLEAAWETNNSVRADRDWESQECLATIGLPKRKNNSFNKFMSRFFK